LNFPFAIPAPAGAVFADASFADADFKILKRNLMARGGRGSISHSVGGVTAGFLGTKRLDCQLNGD